MSVYIVMECTFTFLIYVYRLAQWIKDAAEKKKVAEEEKKARRERRRAGPKHIFNDVKYMNQIEANAENISDALKQGTVLPDKTHFLTIHLYRASSFFWY